MTESDFLNGIFLHEKTRLPKENEYRDKKTGLIHCCVCGMPKQSSEGGFLHSSMCRCEREAEEKRAAEEAKKEREKRINALKHSCFLEKPAYRDAVFESCRPGQNDEKLDFCRRYCENRARSRSFNSGLILCGDVGRGKTHAAACIANKLIEDCELHVKFISEHSFLDNYYDSSGRREFMRELLHCDVLIYDDLGVKTLDKSGRPTGYTAFAEDLTDRCYDTGKTLIITTNLPKEFFRRAHGSRDVDRIVSRLREMTLQPIVFTGDDMREIIGRETIEALSKR